MWVKLQAWMLQSISSYWVIIVVTVSGGLVSNGYRKRNLEEKKRFWDCFCEKSEDCWVGNLKDTYEVIFLGMMKKMGEKGEWKVRKILDVGGLQ